MIYQRTSALSIRDRDIALMPIAVEPEFATPPSHRLFRHHGRDGVCGTVWSDAVVSETAEYPIGTLYQMADIPDEAMPRFLAELPLILADVRRVKTMMGGFNEAFNGMMAMRPEQPSWVDDDLGVCNMTVSADGVDGQMTVTTPLGGVA